MKVSTKKRTNRFLSGFVMGMLAMAVVVAAIGAGIYFSRNDISKKVSTNASEKVDYLEKIINAYYLEDIDKSKLEEGIYKGLLSGLDDPYSVYYTSDEYKKLLEDTTGKYYGIGALVSQAVDTGIITASKIFEGSPAEKAGMKSGDAIYKVAGKEVTGEDLDEVVSDIKGDKGTQVNVTVYRASQKKYIDLTITRDEINVPTISYKMLDNNRKIGYIQIIQFEEVTYNQFAKALQDLKKQGMKAVIFDIRDNPGGLYSVVCKMLDDLLPEGTLVFTKNKYGTEDKETSDSDCLNIPMVVIQNENSASASEIFAGAIQDFNAGKIVGTQSFGKGIVQSILPLGDGSAVKLTIEKYYTPSGKNIHEKGITPDVVVKEDTASKEDVQLIKAKEVIEELIKK